MTSRAHNGTALETEGTPWRHIGIALAMSLAGTLLLGGALLVALGNIWLGTLAAILSLFSSGIYLGRRLGEPEPLYGTLLAALFVGLVILGVFAGTMLAVLPDPLPGLAIGDSTFFFVSPLLLLVAGVGGSVVGGTMTRSSARR